MRSPVESQIIPGIAVDPANQQFQYSADSIRLTQLLEECLHGTQALRFVRQKDEMISIGDGDDMGRWKSTFD